MASDRRSVRIVTALLMGLLVTGCAGTLGVKQTNSDQKNPEESVAENDSANDLSGVTGSVVIVENVPLPKQTYNQAGDKIPYVPSPNPYLNVKVVVPQDAKAKFALADDLMRQGNLKTAKKRFREITQQYPQLSGPWVKLGAIAEQKEKMDDAIRMYKKAIAVNPNNLNAYIALGLAQRKQGYFADTQDTYIEALKVWKDFPEVHLNLAIFYDLYINKPEVAQKHYEAYQFLTNEKSEKVRKWLVEVKRRTGIESSFIDTPPQTRPASKSTNQSGVVANPEPDNKASAG